MYRLEGLRRGPCARGFVLPRDSQDSEGVRGRVTKGVAVDGRGGKVCGLIGDKDGSNEWLNEGTRESEGINWFSLLIKVMLRSQGENRKRDRQDVDKTDRQNERMSKRMTKG